MAVLVTTVGGADRAFGASPPPQAAPSKPGPRCSRGLAMAAVGIVLAYVGVSAIPDQAPTETRVLLVGRPPWTAADAEAAVWRELGLARPAPGASTASLPAPLVWEEKTIEVAPGPRTLRERLVGADRPLVPTRIVARGQNPLLVFGPPAVDGEGTWEVPLRVVVDDRARPGTPKVVPFRYRVLRTAESQPFVNPFAAGWSDVFRRDGIDGPGVIVGSRLLRQSRDGEERHLHYRVAPFGAASLVVFALSTADPKSPTCRWEWIELDFAAD